MAVPVWVTNHNLGNVFSNTNLLIDLNTAVSSDIFELVITSDEDLSDPLNVGTKNIKINNNNVYLGASSGAGNIISQNLLLETQELSILNLGGIFNLRSLDISGPTPALISTSITLEIVVESRLPTFPLAGNLKIGSSSVLNTIDLSGIADVSSLINLLNSKLDNATYGLKAISNNGGFFIVRNSSNFGNDIVVDTSGVSSGDIGITSGTYLLNIKSVIKTINRQRPSGSFSFARNEDITIDEFNTQNLTDGSWTKTNVTAAQETGVIDPDNTQVYRIETTGAGSTAEIANNTGTPVNAGEKRVFRVNIKANNVAEWIMIEADQSGGGAWFNIQDGLVGTVQINNADITRLDNGWFECKIEYTATGNDTNDSHKIKIVSADAATTYPLTAGHNILIGDLKSYVKGANKIKILNTKAAIAIQDLSANLSEIMTTVASEVTLDNIIIDIDNRTPATNVSAELIGFRIELLGAGVILASGDSFSNDILQLLQIDKAGSPFLSSPITEWLNINKITGVLTGLVPAVNFGFDLAITVRATSTTTDTTDRTFILHINTNEESRNNITWSPGSLGSFDENSISTLSIPIENYDLIQNFSSIFSRIPYTFNFSSEFPMEWNYLRNSNASYLDSLGNLSVAEKNVPRPKYVWNTSTNKFERKGLLVEPTKTNFINSSEDFELWSSTNISLTLGFSSPNGKNAATKIIDNNILTSHFVSFSTFIITSNNYVTFSVFAKAAEHDRIQLRFGGIGSDEYVIYNLSTGTVESSGAGVEDFGIIKYANDWYRIWTQTSFDVSSMSSVQIVLIDANSGDAPIYSGSNEGLYIWGSQLEEGELTSYINTTTGEAVRNEDNITIDLLNSDYEIDVAETPINVTNYLSRASEFNHSVWTKTNAAITPDNIITFDGNGTGDLFVDNNAGGSGNVIVSQNVTVNSGSSTFSVYIKRNTISWIKLNTTSFDTTQSTWFNIRTGKIGTKNHLIAGIDIIGNEWYRCWVSFETNIDLNGNLEIELAETDGGSGITNLDGTNSIYVYGAQLENKIGPGFLVNSITGPTTGNNLTTSHYHLDITNREFKLRPIHKDYTIVSASFNKYESNVLIQDKTLFIDNNGDISGYIPAPGNYNFELVVVYKDEIILGPSTFSLTSISSNNGAWLYNVPLFLDNDLRSDWQIFQSSLLSGSTIYRLNDINFGFGQFEIPLIYGFPDQATDIVITNFNKFYAVIGDIKIASSADFDVIYLDIIPINKSEFHTFNDLKFNRIIISKNFISLREKIKTIVDYSNNEVFPPWMTEWDPRLIIGYVEKGEAANIVSNVLNNPLKGTVIPIDEIRRIDKRNNEIGIIHLTEEEI